MIELKSFLASLHLNPREFDPLSLKWLHWAAWFGSFIVAAIMTIIACLPILSSSQYKGTILFKQYNSVLVWKNYLKNFCALVASQTQKYSLSQRPTFILFHSCVCVDLKKLGLIYRWLFFTYFLFSVRFV